MQRFSNWLLVATIGVAVALAAMAFKTEAEQVIAQQGLTAQHYLQIKAAGLDKAQLTYADIAPLLQQQRRFYFASHKTIILQKIRGYYTLPPRYPHALAPSTP